MLTNQLIRKSSSIKVIDDKIKAIVADGPSLDAQAARVVVAMSGGVDSAVSAALYMRAGYQVIGVTMQLAPDIGSSKRCCGSKDISDARRVADSLGFPHYVIDLTESFKKTVIDDFVDSYYRGETPIPCIRCNQTCKFVDLMKAAQDLDAQALVTGHYVRRVAQKDGVKMYRSSNQVKDQSYFLYTITEEQLAFSRFPLGDWQKSTTREVAKFLGLELAQKAESQDICFVADGKYADFLKAYSKRKSQHGDVVDESGKVLARHEGIQRFTIGQRRGLGFGGSEHPFYVVKIKPESNTVVVGPRSSLTQSSFPLKELHLINPEDGIINEEIEVKVRAVGSPLAGMVKRSAIDDRFMVELNAPHYAIAPGQACVFYAGDKVLGGAWITS